MKIIKDHKLQKRARRHARIRSQVKGTADRPRLSVYRSNTSVYAQIINDQTGITLVSANDIKETKGTKTERAQKVGKSVAEAAKKAGITEVVFDRGGFLYAGRVKALADAAREAGLTF
jgi:large subunit ribosomal protein L18